MGAGPIEVWWNDDRATIDELAEHLEDDGEVVVTIRLDNDGDPEIRSVAASS